MNDTMRAVSLLFAFSMTVGCDKSANESPQAAPSATASIAVSAPTASAKVEAQSAVSAPAVASAPPSATASASARPKENIAPTGVKSASKRIDGKNFALDLSASGCKAASECTMTIRLTAVGDYHVNKEYPYKFTATAAPGVEFLSKAAPNTFTRDAGDFVEQGEKNGTMTVRFKAPAGEAPVAGTYKFSVCSADQCQIEQEKIALVVPVL